MKRLPIGKGARQLIAPLCLLLLVSSVLASGLQLYPVSVEVLDTGVVFHYSLDGGQDPEDISTDQLTLDGTDYLYSHTTQTNTVATLVKAVSETVALEAETGDAQAVLALLAPTLDYTDLVGYTGTLALELDSVVVEEGEKQTSYHTVSQTRSYPHLSSNDSSLVPRTISHSGRTYELADLTWELQASQAVDYQQVPETYTAIATYTAKASSTKVLHYLVTATYSGQATTLGAGNTIYAVHFVPAPIPEPEPEPFPLGPVLGGVALTLAAAGGGLYYFVWKRRAVNKA